MKISLKNKRISYFSNSPGIATVCVCIIVVLLVIGGASQKEVLIIDDVAKHEIVTYKDTVKDVLEQNKIELNPKDKISPEIESIVKDGMKIAIHRAVPVRVIADGKEAQILSAEDTVEDMLAAEGIIYDSSDRIYPEPDTAVSMDMDVRVVRITEKEVTEKQILAYTNEVKEMPEWDIGTDKLIRDGSSGEKVTTFKLTYEDGVEKKKEVTQEKITKPAISHLMAVGTLDWRTVSRGETIKYKKVLTMKATSYTDDIECTGKVGGNTATGTKPTRNSDGGKWSTVAVDSREIPLGTKLWIEGYGFAIAEDTGGAVKGNIIDLFFNGGTEEYRRWSTHRVRVYVLK